MDDPESSFPEEAFRLGKTYQLGEPQDQYGTGFNRFAGCVVLVVIGIVGPVIAAGGLSAPGGIVAIAIVLVVFSFVLLIAFFQRKWRVYVYTDGFVYKKGWTAQALRWDEIELVRGISYRMANTYGTKSTIWIIRSKHGKAITFGNELYNIDDLMEVIEKHVEKVE